MYKSHLRPGSYEDSYGEVNDNYYDSLGNKIGRYERENDQSSRGYATNGYKSFGQYQDHQNRPYDVPQERYNEIDESYDRKYRLRRHHGNYIN